MAKKSAHAGYFSVRFTLFSISDLIPQSAASVKMSALEKILAITSAFAGVVLCSIAIRNTRMLGGVMDPQRKLVDEAFERARSSARFGSMLVNARLVHDIESVLGMRNPMLQSSRLYASDRDEYFLFICTAGRDGTLMHLSRQRAERMLKRHPEVHRREFGQSPTQH